MCSQFDHSNRFLWFSNLLKLSYVNNAWSKVCHHNCNYAYWLCVVLAIYPCNLYVFYHFYYQPHTLLIPVTCHLGYHDACVMLLFCTCTCNFQPLSIYPFMFFQYSSVHRSSEHLITLIMIVDLWVCWSSLLYLL